MIAMSLSSKELFGDGCGLKNDSFGFEGNTV